MKKYLLGIFAVILAVGMSAYTSVQRTARKPVTQTAYFWYKLNPTTGKISSTVLNPGAQDIKDNVVDGGSNQLTDCSDLNSPECLAGSSSSTLQPGNTPDAPTMDRDNRISHD